MPSKRQNKKNRSENSSSAAAQDKHPLEEQLWTALKRGDDQLLTELLFNKVESSKEDTPYGAEPFVLVAKATAKPLLATVNAKKSTPLTFATAQGLDPELILLLLRAGADVNGKDQTSERATALHHAALAEDGALLDLLIKNGADVRVKNAHGETVLHTLADSHTAGALLEHLMHLMDPVHAAEPAATGTEDRGEETDERDGAGADPFHIPRRRTIHVDPLKLLAMQDEEGSTPLHVALASVSDGSADVANALLKVIETRVATLTPSSSSSEALSTVLAARRRSDGASTLHVLLGSGSTEDANGDATATLPVLRKLLSLKDASVDWSAEDIDHNTPVELAVRRFAKPDQDTEQLLSAVLEAALQQDGTDVASLLSHRSGVRGETLMQSVILVNNGSAAKVLEKALSSAADKDTAARSLRALANKQEEGEESDGVDLLMDLLRDRACSLAVEADFNGANTTTDDYCGISESVFAVLVHLGVLAEEHVERIKATARSMLTARAEARQQQDDSLDEGDDDATTSGANGGAAVHGKSEHAAESTLRQRSGGGSLKAGGARLSRAQQSHKARAAAAAVGGEAGAAGVARRKQGDSSWAGKEKAAGGVDGMSLPAKVLLILLVLGSAFFAYTSVTNPVLSTSEDKSSFA